MYHIPVGFYFKVEVSGVGSSDDVLFQEVAGLSAEINVEEVQEGGQNRYTHRLPNGVKYGNLVLKRGMFTDSELAQWCRDAIEDFTFETRDVTVTLLNEEGAPLASWQFVRAWPVKWSISDFKAQDNSLVIESLELAHGGFRKG